MKKLDSNTKNRRKIRINKNDNMSEEIKENGLTIWAGVIVIIAILAIAGMLYMDVNKASVVASFILAIITTATVMVSLDHNRKILDNNEKTLNIMKMNNRPHVIIENVKCRIINKKREPQIRFTVRVSNDGGIPAIFEEVSIRMGYDGNPTINYIHEKIRVSPGAYFEFDSDFEFDDDIQALAKKSVEIELYFVYRHIDDISEEKASLYDDKYKRILHIEYID